MAQLKQLQQQPFVKAYLEHVKSTAKRYRQQSQRAGSARKGSATGDASDAPVTPSGAGKRAAAAAIGQSAEPTPQQPQRKKSMYQLNQSSAGPVNGVHMMLVRSQSRSNNTMLTHIVCVFW